MLRSVRLSLDLSVAVHEPSVFKALLGSILDAVVATYEELLLRGGPKRKYKPADVAIFYEDFAELESWCGIFAVSLCLGRCSFVLLV
eukprot:SAG31_NODE_11_length_38734_cov_21.263854_12_plen_87_part_00